MKEQPRLILVAGATGYIASRLIPRLLEKGYRVRCMARNPERLQGRRWHDQVEVVCGDVTRPETLPPAMQGVSAAYYLIHSMTSGKTYQKIDLQAARQFAAAAQMASLKQIIYLGGLANNDEAIAPHLHSRMQTGDQLRTGGVPVTEFRAGVIIGPGSISFEMIRFLSEQLPVLIGPRWMSNLSQPIATENVIAYLLAALETPHSLGKTYEIGGLDQMTYAESMLRYAHLRGLKRKMIVLPWLPLGLMALAVHIMTPVPASIARPLIEGLGSHSFVNDTRALRDFPDIEDFDYETSLTHALSQLHPKNVEPVWLDSSKKAAHVLHEGFFISHRRVELPASAAQVFEVIHNLGGKPGWLFANWIWTMRGKIDQWFAGPGMRGRPQDLSVGANLDFYRVEALQADTMLRLKAELKAPGEGWMEWHIEPHENGCLLVQNAYFAPRGVWGFVYWLLLFPVHQMVFSGLIKKITEKAIASALTSMKS